MRTRNPNPGRSRDRVLGRIAPRRSGTPGQTHTDASGGDVTAPESLFVGAQVSGEDGEIAIITIAATGQQSTNNSGADLDYGDVVVRESDGSVTTTTTPADTRPVGVVQVGGADGQAVSVVFSGYVSQINSTGTIVAGDYLQTSSVAGRAESAGAVRTTGSFGTADDVNPDPPGFLFGVTDTSPAAVSGDYVTTDEGGGERNDTIVSSGTAQELDLADGNVFYVTLDDDCDFTTTGWINDGRTRSIVVELTWDGASHVPTFDDAGLVWLDPSTSVPTTTPPDFPTADGAVARVVLASVDGGTTIGASLIGTGSGSGTTATDTNIWRPVLDGAGAVIADGTGQALMAWGPA